MLKFELATSQTLNIDKYCNSYLNGLADLWCLRGGTRRREFRYIYKPDFQDQRTRVFVSCFSNDNEEFQWNSKKYSIDITSVKYFCLLLICFEINQDWDRSFKKA